MVALFAPVTLFYLPRFLMIFKTPNFDTVLKMITKIDHQLSMLDLELSPIENRIIFYSIITITGVTQSNNCEGNSHSLTICILLQCILQLYPIMYSVKAFESSESFLKSSVPLAVILSLEFFIYFHQSAWLVLMHISYYSIAARFNQLSAYLQTNEEPNYHKRSNKDNSSSKCVNTVILNSNQLRDR